MTPGTVRQAQLPDDAEQAAAIQKPHSETVRQAQLADDGPFEARAVEVMRELRVAFLGLIHGLPGPIHRPPDLVRVLGVSRTLAWQVHRIATNPNPLAVGADVPGTAAVKQMLRAAQAAGVKDQHLSRVTDAMRAFEALVAGHAGHRAAFAAMIKSVTGPGAEAIDLKARRQAFRINSQLWGVQVKTILGCVLHRPGKTAALLDTISIRGHRDIRCLRAGATLRVAGHRLSDGKDAHRQLTEPFVVGSESALRSSGPRLLLDFCSQPCPELEHRVEDGYLTTYLREMPLGTAGMRTLYLADMSRDLEWRTLGDARNTMNINAAIRKPAEALVLDTLVYRDMFGVLEPKVNVFGSLDRPGVSDPQELREDEVLPMHTEVHGLGIGLDVLPTSQVPRYAEMVGAVCRDIGWDPGAFEVYRCIVEYPMLGSIISVRFDLPDNGNW